MGTAAAVVAVIVVTGGALAFDAVTAESAQAATTWNPSGYAQGTILPSSGSVCPVGTYYQVQTMAEGGNATVYSATFTDTASLEYTEVGTLAGINSIAIDPSNNFMIGAVNATTAVDSGGAALTRNDLVYVDRTTGMFYGLGKPASAADGVAPDWNTTNAFNAGAFGDDDTYYVSRGSTATLYVVNFDSADFWSEPEWTSVTLHYADGSAAASPADFTYDDGYLWGRQDNNGAITRIDPATGLVTRYATTASTNVTAVTIDGQLPSDAATGNNASATGGAFTFGNGNLGLVYNNGTTTQLSYDSADNPTIFTVVANYDSPAGQGTDGTSCLGGEVDLSIVKTGATEIGADGTIEWTLTVTNNSTTLQSSGGVFSDLIPPGYIVTGTSAGGTIGTASAGGTPVTFTSGVLDPGGQVQVTITATASALINGSCVNNTAQVIGNEADSNAENNTSTLTTCVGANEPGLAVSKSADPASGSQVDPGQQITYSITAENTGNVNLTDVTVVDDLADVLDNAVFVTGSELAEVGGAPRGLVTVAGGTLTWVGDLAVGESATITYAVTVNDDVTSEDALVNVVTANGSWGCDETGEGCAEVPSNCPDVAVASSDGSGCETTHTPTDPPVVVTPSPTPTDPPVVVTPSPTPTGGSSSGDLAITGGGAPWTALVAGGVLLTLGLITTGVGVRRRRRQTA